jgi:AhpD family alkylhydroperoxidase
MANSPLLVNSFVAAIGQFALGSFSDGERQVLLLTNAVANSCPWAVGFHSTLALKEGIDADDVAAIRLGQAPSTPRVAALSSLTRTLIERRGHLDATDAEAFRTAGFDDGQLLEVISGVAISTLANYAGALDAILTQQEPYPAVVMDRGWDIRQTNNAATRLFDLLTAGHAPGPPGPPPTCCA